MSSKPLFLSFLSLFSDLWGGGTDVLLLKNKLSASVPGQSFVASLLVTPQFIMVHFSRSNMAYEFVCDLKRSRFTFNGQEQDFSSFEEEISLSFQWFYEAYSQDKLLFVEGIKRPKRTKQNPYRSLSSFSDVLFQHDLADKAQEGSSDILFFCGQEDVLSLKELNKCFPYAENFAFFEARKAAKNALKNFGYYIDLASGQSKEAVKVKKEVA